MTTLTLRLWVPARDALGRDDRRTQGGQRRYHRQPAPLLSGSFADKGGQSGALPTLRTCVGISPRHQVTHLPGCSSFATSVSTLTGGSQATMRFDFSAAGFAEGWAGARLRASFCTGMRSSTEVSARLSTFSSTVRVGWAWGILASRSPLAVRLMPAAPAGSRVPGTGRPASGCFNGGDLNGAKRRNSGQSGENDLGFL